MTEQLDHITKDFLALVEKISDDKLKTLTGFKLRDCYIDDLRWLMNKYVGADYIQILKKIVNQFPGFRYLIETYDNMFDITADAKSSERFLLFIFEYRFSRPKKFDFTEGYQFGRFARHVMKDHLENDQACVVNLCNKFKALKREKIISNIERCGYEVTLNDTTHEITGVHVVKYTSIRDEDKEKDIIAVFNAEATKFLEQHAPIVSMSETSNTYDSCLGGKPVGPSDAVGSSNLDFDALYPTIRIADSVTNNMQPTKILLQTDQIDLFETSLDSVTKHAKQSIAKMREQHENILILKGHVVELEKKNKEIQDKLDKYQEIINKISTELMSNR